MPCADGRLLRPSTPDLVPTPWTLNPPARCRALVASMLTVSSSQRITIEALAAHPWFTEQTPEASVEEVTAAIESALESDDHGSHHMAPARAAGGRVGSPACPGSCLAVVHSRRHVRQAHIHQVRTGDRCAGATTWPLREHMAVP